MAESSAYRLDKDKEDAIHSWISATLGLSAGNVIWDRPNASRPDPPYALLNILSGPRKTSPSAEERYKELDTFVYAMRKEFTLTVGIYGGNGYLKQLGNLIDSLEKPSALTTLRQAGLACWGSEDPVDLSTLLDTQFEDRAAVDIVFAYGEAMEDDAVGEIQSVRYKGLYRPFKSDENTILLYHLDGLSGSVADSSSNGFNGVNVGCRRGEPGVFNNSFFFEEQEYTYVDFLSSGFETLWKAGACNEGTVEFYIKMKYDLWKAPVFNYLFAVSASVLLQYFNYIHAYTVYGEIYFSRRMVPGAWQQLVVNTKGLNLGTDWHFLRFTWTANELKVWIDGKLLGTNDTAGVVWDVSKPLNLARIGASPNVTAGINDSWIDEFRISDIVKTEKDYFLIDKTVTIS